MMFATRWSQRLTCLQSYPFFTDKAFLLHKIPRCLLFSQNGKWEKDFNSEIATDIEKHWENVVLQKPPENPHGEKFYALSMFPYPSGQLHMGHVRVYTISDVMARYHRLNGKQVIHPMGWDAFGLPAENAARERGEAPDKWTYSNIKHMKKQLKQLGCLFDWEREFATCHPDYYKWTQNIFLKMFKAGLAYQKQAEVNWDPVDQTVLADEQIDEEGKSWRSGVMVEKRFLRQWYLKTTVYAKSLLDGLEDVNPKMWGDVIKIQKHWLGDCTGTRFQFKIHCGDEKLTDPLDVFTSHPENVFGASFISLSPSHWLNQAQYYQNPDQFGSTEDCMLKLKAVHPFTGQMLPVIVSTVTEQTDSHLGMSNQTDSHLGVPCCNEEDRRIASQFHLPIPNVLEEKQGSTLLIHSQQFSGLTRTAGAEAIRNHAKQHGFGGHMVSSKLNDWLISRQRFWGTPIPVIHCPKCKAVPVPEDDLPVVLPNMDGSHDNRLSPLSEMVEWKTTTCPSCGGPACRETDTMDTFLDSSWYFLRYLDPDNTKEPYDPAKVKNLMPVDLYIGGKEHAVLHLYFARFFCHFLYDKGLLPYKEPFVDLLTQGMVMGQSYQVKSTGRYLTSDKVNIQDDCVTEKSSGEAVIVKWEKMSKSKFNGVNPQEVLEEFGTDSTRLCILSDVAPRYDRHWSLQAFTGITNWQKKIWILMEEYLQACLHRNPSLSQSEGLKLFEKEIYDSRNYHLKEVTYYMSKTYMLNTAIAKLQSYTKDLRKDNFSMELKVCSALYEQALADFIIMLSPFSPSFASELWAGLTSVTSLTNSYLWDKGVFHQTWPQLDTHYKLPLIVKVNMRSVFKLKIPQSEIEQLTAESAYNLIKDNTEYQKYVKPCPASELNLSLETKPSYQVELRVNPPLGLIKEPPKKKKKKVVSKLSEKSVGADVS